MMDRRRFLTMMMGAAVAPHLPKKRMIFKARSMGVTTLGVDGMLSSGFPGSEGFTYLTLGTVRRYMDIQKERAAQDIAEQVYNG